MPIEPDVAGGDGIAQLRKELQAHRRLLAVIEAAKRGTCHVARPFDVNVPEASTSATTTLGLALGAPSLSHTSTRKNSVTHEDACTDRLQKPVAWTCRSRVASLPEAAAHGTLSGEPYASKLAKSYTAEARADHTSLQVQSAPQMPPIAAVVTKSAAIRPPWRGTFHRATSAAAPRPAGREPTCHALHQTHYSHTGIISSAHRAKARPPTGTRRAADAASNRTLGGDIDADALTRTLGKLAAAAAISVMAQGKPKLSPLPYSPTENVANKAWCSGKPNRCEVSGVPAGMAMTAHENVVHRTSRAAVVKGAATGVGSTRAASAVAAQGDSTRPRLKPIGTAASNSQKLFTAHANRNVPAAAASASKRPVPEASKDLPGSGRWSANGVPAADFGDAIRDQQASCDSQRDVTIVEYDRPSEERFVIASGQRDASLFSALKGYRALHGNRFGANHKASATPTTEGNASARNSDIYVGIDQDPAGVPCKPAPPAFPVIERLLHRRERLSALLMARCAGAAPPLDSPRLCSDERTRSAPPSAFVSLLCGTGHLACEQRSDPGQDQTMPGDDRARSVEPMICPNLTIARFEVDTASARPFDGGDQRHSFDSRLRNTEMPGVSAAAATRGDTAVAADAYTIMRAWRQRRAAAAAIICRAARRYLDAGAAAEQARVSAAAESLAACIKARVLAAWQGVYHRRSRLRRQYTRLVALSLKAQYVACVHPGPMAEDINLAEIHAGLAAELAAAVYAPDRTSRSKTTSNSVLYGTWDSAHGSCQHGDTSYGVPYGLVHGWGATATSHRRYCTAASVDKGRYGIAVAHRRWWLLRAAWCSLIVHAIAPLRWSSLTK